MATTGTGLTAVSSSTTCGIGTGLGLRSMTAGQAVLAAGSGMLVAVRPLICTRAASGRLRYRPVATAVP